MFIRLPNVFVAPERIFSSCDHWSVIDAQLCLHSQAVLTHGHTHYQYAVFLSESENGLGLTCLLDVSLKGTL